MQDELATVKELFFMKAIGSDSYQVEREWKARWPQMDTVSLTQSLTLLKIGEKYNVTIVYRPD